jgi:hypothetical protein
VRLRNVNCVDAVHEAYQGIDVSWCFPSGTYGSFLYIILRLV